MLACQRVRSVSVGWCDVCGLRSRSEYRVRDFRGERQGQRRRRPLHPAQSGSHPSQKSNHANPAEAAAQLLLNYPICASKDRIRARTRCEQKVFDHLQRTKDEVMGDLQECLEQF